MDLPMLESYTDNIDGKEYAKHSSRDVEAPYFYYEVHTGYEKSV